MEIPRGSRLVAMAQMRLAPALERVLKSALGARVQRMGAQALRRVAARFPALAELVGLRPAAQHQVAIARSAEHVHLASSDSILVAPALPVAALRDRLAHDPAWQQRARAAADLAHADAQDAVEPLLRALQDPSAEVASAAIESLAFFPSARTTAAFELVLANRDGYFSPVTRAAAVVGLARVSGDAAPRSLLEALSDVDAEVSLAAIAALSEHAPARSAAPILAIASDRSGYYLPFVRLAAANALVRGAALSHETALQLRRSEPDPAVRRALEQVVAG
jgi:HEAT repeat protein